MYDVWGGGSVCFPRATYNYKEGVMVRAPVSLRCVGGWLFLALTYTPHLPIYTFDLSPDEWPRPPQGQLREGAHVLRVILHKST